MPRRRNYAEPAEKSLTGVPVNFVPSPSPATPRGFESPPSLRHNPRSTMPDTPPRDQRPRTRALTILRDHGPMRQVEFAARMWPESRGHKKPTGMNLASGGYLGKLRKAGLVRYRIGPCADDVLEYEIAGAGVLLLEHGEAGPATPTTERDA